jgi:homoserine kinase
LYVHPLFLSSKCHVDGPKPQIPGLPEVTSRITPESHPGLLGICLSGAGPTILALATDGFEAIAEDARAIFKGKGIEIDWKILQVAGGSVVQAGP